MINAVVPQGPPVAEAAGRAPTEAAPAGDPRKAFDEWLPGQTRADPTGDDAAAGTKTPARTARATREKTGGQPTAGPMAPDATLAAAAQLAPLVDLRTLAPPVKLSLDLVAPNRPVADGAPPAAGDAPIAPDAPKNGAPGPNLTGEGEPSPVPPASPSPIGSVREPGSPPPVALQVPGKTPAPDIPTLGHAVPLTGGTDLPIAPTVGDSRLAAPPPVHAGQAKGSEPATAGQAKIAASARPKADSADGLEINDVQDSQGEILTMNEQPGGTSVAKQVDVVNATFASKEKEAGTGSPAKRGDSVAVAPPALSRVGKSYQAGSEVIMSAAVAGASDVGAATAQIAAGTAPASGAAARQIVQVETLLQQALSIGESARPDGQGQLEMRVRLGGGAEDVTVQMQVTNDRLQVTFQTDSPALRQALESGWQQFSTTASQTSTLSLAPPRYESGNFDPGVAGARADAQGFSSGQQNSRRQDPAATAAEDGLPSGGSMRTVPVGVSAVTTSPAQTAGRRWNGWA